MEYEELKRVDVLTAGCETRITALVVSLSGLSPWDIETGLLYAELNVQEMKLRALQAYRQKVLALVERRGTAMPAAKPYPHRNGERPA